MGGFGMKMKGFGNVKGKGGSSGKKRMESVTTRGMRKENVRDQGRKQKNVRDQGLRNENVRLLENMNGKYKAIGKCERKCKAIGKCEWEMCLVMRKQNVIAWEGKNEDVQRTENKIKSLYEFKTKI